MPLASRKPYLSRRDLIFRRQGVDRVQHLDLGVGTVRLQGILVPVVHRLLQARAALDLLHGKATGGHVGIGDAEAEAQALGFLDRVTEIDIAAQGVGGVAGDVDLGQVG